MSHIFRERTHGNHSKRHTSTIMLSRTNSSNSITEHLPSPFDDPGFTLSDSELRETAYEIFVGSCRSSGSRPLTYIPQSDKMERSSSTVLSSPSLQRSLTSTAASKVKKALGLKSSHSTKKGTVVSNQGKNSAVAATGVRSKKAVTIGELMRVQMRVSEQADTRIRRALLRISTGQQGKRIESVVLPLELLQQFKSIDFINLQEYEAWKRRNLKVLEAGLLLYPHIPKKISDPDSQRLRQIITGALEKPIETGKHYETMQNLRISVLSLACKSIDGSVSETCHWADGFPLNLRIYQLFLEASFDINEETLIIEEVDEVLELIKKTWVVLGLNQLLHNICFSWVLFNRYVSTGEVEDDLLFAANNMLIEVEKDARGTKDHTYSKILSSTLGLMSGWVEKKLFAYHESFNHDNINSMHHVVSIGLLAAKVLEDISNKDNMKSEVDVAYDRVDTYIRSSLRAAFSQIKKQSKDQPKSRPMLSIIAEATSKLAFDEKITFSPTLKKWHPLSAGVAVAILHSCFGNELKQFVSNIGELTPDAVQVLKAADKLEKDLVQIAVEDSVDSEDGGKSVIQEMPPYEAESVLADLVRSWVKTRVERLKEWVDRNWQQEVWNPRANKDKFAPSAVEVLRLADETLEAFFLLPIPMHQALLPGLMDGIDKALQHYIVKTKSGCGTRTTFIPTMPALTRCTKNSKLHGVFKKKEKSVLKKKKSQLMIVNTNEEKNSMATTELCVRINSLQYIRSELEVLAKRTITHLRNCETNHVNDFSNGDKNKFELSYSACVEGIQQLCEATAYKVVFHDLSHVLWDGLYINEVSSSRIESFLIELEQNLEIIATTVHDKVRTRLITDLMKASFDGFMLVLLAGGPSRSFTQQDSVMIEEDFKFLTDLFWSNGDGLPTNLIEKHSDIVKGVLPLLHSDTGNIIEKFKRMVLEGYESGSKMKLPLPATSGRWDPADANTVLRVLCYRNDEMATKFLKKTYNLPKKL